MLIESQEGSGKTSLVLLALLALSEDDADPVPVLLDAASWGPSHAGGFYGWMARSLRDTHLPRATREDVEELLRQGRLFPVVDGFDALPPNRALAFLEQLNQHWLSRQRVILAVRPPGNEAVAGALARLWNHADVTMQSETLSPARAVAHLVSYDHERANDPDLEAIRPRSALAGALETPWMLTVLRDVLDDDPSLLRRLADTTNYPTAGDIQAALLARLPAALYRASERARPADPRSLSRWPEESVLAWAAFIARFLQRADVEAISLWHLPQALPATSRYSLAVSSAVFGALGATLFPGLLVGGGVGASAGLLLAVVASRVAGRASQAMSPNAPRKQNLLLRLRPKGPLHTIVFGSAAGVLVGLLSPFVLEAVWGPLAQLATALAAAAAGAVLGSVGWARMNEDYVREDLDASRTPQQTYRDDRRRTLVALAVAGAICTAAVVAFGVLLGGVVAGAALGFLAGAVVESLPNGAWPSFVVACLLFRVGGTLPLRLPQFLEACESAGLLRVLNGGYRFRHRLLQESLATEAASARDGGAGAGATTAH